MKRKLFIMAAALMASVAATAAQLTVNVQTAGTLEAVINAQSVTNITDLTITGKLGAPDIAYLRQCEGRIASLCTLNMRGATLVPSDEPYLIDNGFAFFISNEEKFVPAKSNPNATPVSYSGMFARSRATGPFFAKAAEGEFNPEKYNCYYGKGLPGAFQWSPLEKIIMPSDVKKVGMWAFANSNLLETVEVPGGLTTIADKAFKGNVSLTNINLSGVTEIGTEAFSGCTGLTEVNLNSLQTIGESAFMGCTGIIGTVNFPRLKKVSAESFRGCTGITGITLSGVSVIDEMAFYNCSGLEKISFSNNLDSIKRMSFSGTKIQMVSFPSSLKYIGSGAFFNIPLETISFANPESSLTIASPSNERIYWVDSWDYLDDVYGAFENTYLKKVVLPEGLLEIGNRAFLSCSSLEEAILPSSLIRIGVVNKTEWYYSSFYTHGGAFGYTKLSKIDLPKNLKEIGDETFLFCSNLESITLPNNLNEIGGGAFYGCRRLASVSFPTNIQYIGNGAFSETKWAKEQKPGADGVLYYGPIAVHMELSSVPDGTTIKIKEGTASVGAAFFYDVAIGNNVSVELPSTLRNINGRAFRGSDISKAVFKEGLTRIEELAFCDCRKLKSADLPSTVKYIGRGAFDGCDLLTKMIIPEDMEEIGGPGSWGIQESAFNNSGIAQLTIRARHLKDNAKIGSLPSLTRIVVGSEVEVLPAGLVSGSADLLRVVFEDRAESNRLFVGRQCFPYSNLSSLTLPNCQLEIDEYAFTVGGYYSYPSTTEVEVLGTVVAMAPYAFSSYDTWSGLKSSIRLGGGIKEIPSSAFSGCSGLTGISIPNTVKTIGEYAFYSCTSLTSINIPSSVTYLGERSFSSCSSLKSACVPTERIGDHAFSNCSNLSILELGNNVKEIGNFSFCGIGITSVTIPEGVTSIGSDAFGSCKALTSVTIPSSVTSIGSCVFKYCI